jgi:hypothetical protein
MLTSRSFFRPRRVTKALPRRVTIPEFAAINNGARQLLSHESFDWYAPNLLIGRRKNVHAGIIPNRLKAL